MSKRKILILILIAAMLIAIFGLVMHLIEKHGENDEQFGDTGEWGETGNEIILDFPEAAYATTDSISSYLLIGTDAGGEDMGEGFNGELADFLTLLVVDSTTEKYAFVQIDRNTMTDVEVLDASGESKGPAYEQICISHWYGPDAEARNENTVKAVSDLMGGFPIDGYYTLHMGDIGLVNDAIGGVTVDIQTDMTDVDPEFKQGARVLLDNEQAEKFIRARMNTGSGTNKERMSRQYQYMTSAYNMVMMQLRENPEYVNDLYDQLHDVVESSDKSAPLGKLTNQLVQFENKGIIEFEGKTEVNDTQADGTKHEEFYTTPDAIVATLRQVMNLEIPE